MKSFMTFSDYMNAWLYGPSGYYSTYKTIGKEGDFYTAVSSSKYFGGAIANFLLRRIKEGALSSGVTVCEIGAHKGYLLVDMIEFIYTLEPDLLKTLEFVIVERFDHLQEAQRSYFRDAFGDAVALRHVKSLEELSLDEAFFVANEIFDAFGCDLIYEGKIAHVKNHTVLFEDHDDSVLATAARYGQTKGEVARGYEAFAQSMARAAVKSEFVTFDYGDVTVRNDFSARIYANHQVFPLFEEGLSLQALFGKSDLTYDVNFSHLIDAYKTAGFEKVAYKTQLAALVDFGMIELLELLKKHANQTTYLIESGKIKTLIDPSIMGERFKMVHFKKDL